MNWQALLSKIGVCEPPLPDLVREASDRRGTVDRRAFLKLAGFGVAAMALDPEALLWTPGERVMLLPLYRGGTLITPDWIMKEMGRRLVANIKFSNHLFKTYDERFASTGAVLHLVP